MSKVNVTEHRTVRKVSKILCPVAYFSVWLLAGRPGNLGFVPAGAESFLSATVLPRLLPFSRSPDTEGYK